MKNLIPLSNWLLDDAVESTVAVDALADSAAISRADLFAKVGAWYQQLQSLTHGRWALYHQDPVEFIAALLALWQLKRTACIPGDNCAGTVARLKSQVVGFIGDFPTASDAIEHTGHVSHDGATDGESICWQPLATDWVALEIFTSGSEGEPKGIPKSIGQLEREIETLERLWPSEPDTIVLATVSHQHIYGLLFRLLWPLCSRRPLERNLCHYPEDIQQWAARYPKLTLVSSPSHLNRFAVDQDWLALSRTLVILFSSAAPLARDISLRIRALLGQGVHEIYGSSETGGIAWRVQEMSVETSWQLLPGIGLRKDDEACIWLRSPHLPDASELALPDRIELATDGSFRLLGRVDRVAKVEGKRVALNVMERQLCQIPWIDAASCLSLHRSRVEVAAVLQLTELGAVLLADLGKRALIQQLREHLKAHFEAVVLPRRWRFVAQLPYSSQGKLPLAALQALFEPGAPQASLHASPSPRTEPCITRLNQDPNSAQLALEIPVDLLYFQGHFSAQEMILPGVVQVHWAEYFGRQLFGLRGRFIRLEAIKFQQLIRPGQRLSLELKSSIENNKLGFSYRSAAGVHSSGRICFGDADV